VKINYYADIREEVWGQQRLFLAGLADQ